MEMPRGGLEGPGCLIVAREAAPSYSMVPGPSTPPPGPRQDPLELHIQGSFL